MNIHFCIAPLVVASALFSLPAFADVITPEDAACRNKSPGDVCDESLTHSGICRKSTCSRIDYRHWDRDASASPPSLTYDCVVCDTRTPNDESTAPANDDTAPRNATQDNLGGTQGVGMASPGNGSSAANGCSVGPVDASSLLGAWLLAGLVPLALARTRRKAP